MILSLFELWINPLCFGFSLFGYESSNADEDMQYSLLGFYWDREDRTLQVDLFWTWREFAFKKQVV